MDYIHVKNLEKYHPNYKDRKLIWCKVYFSMINSDPEFILLDEIDKWRFISFVMLELQIKRPIPLDTRFLTLKGFDLKKRNISLTLKMLHDFLEVVTEPLLRVREDKEEDTYVTEQKPVEEKPLEEKQRVAFEYVWSLYPRRLEKKRAYRAYCATVTSKALHIKCVRAVENYLSEIEDKGTPDKYIKHGSTFFNNWEDYYNLNPIEDENAGSVQGNVPAAAVSA